jgi:L-ascorbate metabolism protein UlaG (beta-lactamase superfamily)
VLKYELRFTAMTLYSNMSLQTFSYSYHAIKRRFRMIHFLFILLMIASLFAFYSTSYGFETDVIKTSGGDLEITFIGHGTLMFQYNGKIIHVDPWTKLADYTRLPKADIILLTHHHQDHFDLKALEQVQTADSRILLTQTCAKSVAGGIVMKYGDVQNIDGFQIEATPAYNLVHMRKPGFPFHPKYEGNGYVITFGNERVYVAGDTENIPEMKQLKGIDVAFLPMNLPYTMTPEMAADAALAFKPKILYPYHFGDTDTEKLVVLLKDHPEIELRIRELQ